MPLVRRQWRRDKKQPIEPAASEHMPGQIEMALVDRIKGPAEQADGQRCLCSGHASGAGFATAVDNELLSGQLFEPHGSVGMQLGGGDADFRAQTELTTIVEPC